MKRNVAVGLGIVTVLALAGAAWFFSQGDAEPTTDVTAPPIESSETTIGESDPVQSTAPAVSEQPTTFELTDATTATFRIDEELRGSPKTVVGTSNVVLGQIQIDRDDLANSQIGEILINARVFETDSALRNRAIRGPILDTDAFEFVSFEPTSIDRLEGIAEVGDELSFSITGDLTIRDVTEPVTFEVTATLTSDTTIEGSATTIVERGPFELAIPSVPTVANVSESVPLELTFVAESA